MPQLSLDQSSSLESPISVEEFRAPLPDLKSNKALGPDGYTGTYYKLFGEELEKHYLRAFNGFHKDGSNSAELLKASLILIPKEAKDGLNCSSHRPISLLNQGVKIFSKILKNRMLPLMAALIHLDQVGFMPTGEARDNAVRVLALTSRASSCRGPSLLLATDTEKAFNRINWGYMEAVLVHIGIWGSNEVDDNVTQFESLGFSLRECNLFRTFFFKQWYLSGVFFVPPDFYFID